MKQKYYPKGYIFAGNSTYYAISLEHLADEGGNPTAGFGWIVVDTIPQNIDEISNHSMPVIYKKPEFIIGGAFITGLPMVDYVECDLGDDYVEDDICDTLFDDYEFTETN